MKGFRLRNILKLLRKLFGIFEHSFYMIKLSFFKPKFRNKREGKAHLLIVEKEVYCKLANICIASFLFFNPNFEINVHCDLKTFSKCSRVFRRFIRKGNLLLFLIDDEKSWQDRKIDLILSLMGSRDIFMDADLRWNSELPLIEGVTFFVSEFSMREKSPERQLLRSFGFRENLPAIMKNTSFFSWQGFVLDRNQRKFIENSIGTFGEILSSADLGTRDIPQLDRLKEQIILSLAAETWNVPIRYLKEIDKHKDGAFVESSYFGATGSSF
jgi:hypothetical protein